MLQKAGLQWDDIVIYHHPETNKHLGIARIILRSSRQTKICIEKFNNKSVMGKVNIPLLDLEKSVFNSSIVDHQCFPRRLRRSVQKSRRVVNDRKESSCRPSSDSGDSCSSAIYTRSSQTPSSEHRGTRFRGKSTGDRRRETLDGQQQFQQVSRVR